MTEPAFGPWDIINAVLIDTVTPTSVVALTDPQAPEKIVIKFQASPPGETSLHTFLFYVDRPDAMILHNSLSDTLKGTTS
jgi:hypothetical protein